MTTGWTIGDWQVGQLTDAELRKGIARYQSALQHHEADAPVRATIADCLAKYQEELNGRLAARRNHRTSAGRAG
jgi:uncharacterized protein YgiB involved in biofilm formation